MILPSRRESLPLARYVPKALTLSLLILCSALPAPTEAAERETPAAPAVQQRGKLLDEMGVSAWHNAGFRGKGVKIAVLDTGFRGYRDFLGKALPDHITVKSFRSDGNMETRDSQHGILCGEVIHAIAPDAELLFATWDVGAADEYLSAFRWAKEQGARIVSCSVITPSWSDGEGGGTMHQELAKILGPGTEASDLLCFASAGNTIDRHWSGEFHDNGQGFHEWKPGTIDNPLRPWNEDQVFVELYWHPGADYDLVVQDVETDKNIEVAHTIHDNRDHNSAVIRFRVISGHSYRVRVRLVSGKPGTFHLTTTWGSLSHTTSKASVCFPADGERVVAMGAVDGEHHRMWYSACGPNSHCPKPDFVAVVPFPSTWRERPFGGTSAAAPQGAALAALLLGRHPDWTCDRIRSLLRGSAQDLETPGHDYQTGYGLLRLPRETEALK
jgi:hypothetical protein